MTDVTKRRVLMVEMILPSRSWAGGEVESFLGQVAPILECTVYGEVSPSEVDAAWC